MIMRLLPGFNLVIALLATALVLLWPLSAAAQEDASPLGTLIFESAPPGKAGQPGAAGESPAGSPAGTGGSEEPADEFSSASIADYLAAINDTLDREGLYSQTLSEHYEALGILHFRAGDYALALEAFEDALHIQKVNKGLFSLDQSRLIDYMIRTYTAQGDFFAVDNHKHYLYYLQKKNLAEDDPQRVVAMQAWADWNIEAYTKGYRESISYPVALTDSVETARRIQNTMRIDVPVRQHPVDNSGISSPGVAPNETVTETVPILINIPLLNSNSVITSAAITDYNLRSIPYALTSDMVINQRLYEAETIYESLLEQLERDQPGDLPARLELQKKLANVNFLLKKELDQYDQIRDQGSIAFNRVNQEYTSDATLISDKRYVQTRNAFEALVEDMESSNTLTARQIADTWLALGDMHLSFERPRRAFDAYARAHRLLVESGLSPEEADRTITPRADLAVPVYGIHNFSREFFGIAPETDIPFRGYIDVTFTKDRFGAVNGLDITATSEDTLPQVRNALVAHLRNQVFRPAMQAGEAVEQEAIRLRYYYYY